MSFRINSGVRTILDEESRSSGVNLNALVSQIFNGYANWGRYVKKLKFIPTSKDLLRQVFGAINREAIEQIGNRLGETAAREEILFLFQEINKETVTRFIHLWASHFDAYEHRLDRGRHFFTVHHDINTNFSVFAKAYLSSTLRNSLSLVSHFETLLPNSVAFSYAD